ncbi:hypothetical protein HC256_000262 [Beauveria bassiana]|nr:hypothetical protein HC256_000262 [Beauveria bassiana]
MHEKPGTDGSEVFIAVNQARHGDGLPILKDIKDGFENIFHSLSRVLQHPDAEDAVFRNIVTMCSLRIRERMRYAPHKRKKSKQTLSQLLEETSALLASEYPEFRQQAKAVIKNIDMWLKHQTERRLCNVVEAVVQLSRNSSLSQMLSSIPNTMMGPSERKNLLKMIRRVARYRDAARFLYRTAKKYPLIRSMKVVMVSLPRNAFRLLSVDYQPDFFVTCTRLQIAHGRQTSVAQVARLLNRDGQTAEESFSHQCFKTIREGKIHAEIQLVYCLETHRPKPAPRVVASSKMACFLCNVFLCQAAKVYTKRCHGRLYPAWKLPVFPSRAVTLLSKQRRTLFPQPSESTLWTMDISATTLGTLLGPGGIVEEESLRLESSVDASREQPTTQAGIGAELEHPLVGQTESSIDIAPLDKLDLLTVRQGSLTTLTLDASTIAPVQAGPVIIQLEYTVGKNGGVGSKLGCNLEWLTREDADAAKDNKNMCIIDAESLDDGVAIPVSNLEGLCISTGGNLVKLEIKS